jgi:hypothetical protein
MERRYSFSDLLALRVAREMREAGILTQSLRRVVDSLRIRKVLTNRLAELLVTMLDGYRRQIVIISGHGYYDDLHLEHYLIADDNLGSGRQASWTCAQHTGTNSWCSQLARAASTVSTLFTSLRIPPV